MVNHSAPKHLLNKCLLKLQVHRTTYYLSINIQVKDVITMAQSCAVELHLVMLTCIMGLRLLSEHHTLDIAYHSFYHGFF